MLTFCPLASRKMVEHWSLAESQFENAISGVVRPSYTVNPNYRSHFCLFWSVSPTQWQIWCKRAFPMCPSLYLKRGANIHQPPQHTAAQRGKIIPATWLNSLPKLPLIPLSSQYLLSAIQQAHHIAPFYSSPPCQGGRAIVTVMMCQILTHYTWSSPWNCETSLLFYIT